LLQRLQSFQMQRASPLVQQTGVRDLVRQRVLEAVFELREETRLIEEFSGLETPETATQIALLLPKESLEQRHRDVFADDGARLQHAPLVRRQAIDAPGEQHLHRWRDLNRRNVCRQAVGSGISGESSGLHERSNAFLEEERVAFGAIDQQALERREHCAVTQERLEQLVGVLRTQRVDPELTVVRLADPGVTVLWTIVDEQKHGGRGKTFHQTVEHCLCFRIEPVEVLQHEEEWLNLALSTQETLDRVA